MRLWELLEVWEEHETRAGLLAVKDNLRGEIIQKDKRIIYALSNLLAAELKDFATRDFFKDIHNGEDIHMDNMDNMDNIEALQSEIEYMTLLTFLTIQV
ncbi:MAG: hypothetical protein ABFC65_02000 [Rectinema sp.]